MRVISAPKFPRRIFAHSDQMRSPETMARPDALAAMSARVDASCELGSVACLPKNLQCVKEVLPYVENS